MAEALMLGGIMKKILLAALLLVWSGQSLSDDIDLYIKNTSSTVQRPSVLIILDNSPSMVWYAPGSNTRLGSGNEHVNNPATRAHKARKIVIDLINDNPEVDFGLQLFNVNDGNSGTKHGGRIVFGLQDLSIPANKAALINILDNDNDNTNNNYTTFNGSYTPLCETLYETYRYLSGGALYYGNHDTNTPQSIISSGNYTSPFADIECNKEITIIYITDGDPTGDTNANGLVSTLTGNTTSGNYVGVLGSWMATKNWHTLNGTNDHQKTNTDIDDTLKSDILASVKIHTVGFGGGVSETSLLKTAARDGIAATEPEDGYYPMQAGGTYHEATTAEALKEALGEIVLEVLSTSSLTSASVSANSFDRTQTLDSVYYGVFEPSTAARWQGNIKKYKVVNGVQVDANDAPAVNAAGEFAEDAKSFWSPAADGNDVSKGGVAEMLRSTATLDRKFLTDITGTGTLTAILSEGTTEATIESTIAAVLEGQYSTDALKAKAFGIAESEVDDISGHIQWAMGIDVDNDDDDTSTKVRADVFGDPLHSKPVVIDYGTGNPRLVVGTNAGVLHMFEDNSTLNSVTENWAYLPNELFKNIKPLRENAITVDNKVYGLDGEITLHINDANNDGIVNNSDTAWLFFGLRRGGRSYYALDVTTPSTPKLMWKIDATSTGVNSFSKLGQTWSKPQVVRSELNEDDADKLVVVFGGGYDTKKDGTGPNTHSDDNGAAIYMVNARTGALIFKKETGSNNGIASSIATLDSDSDAFVDRLYVGDTGGDVWRIDIPDDDQDNTSIIKLASVGGTTDAVDRRFFNKPSIVRTYLLETINTGTESEPYVIKQEIPYDAILIGTGDRATPTAIDTDDMFFMIKDKYIETQQLDALTPAIAPITLSQLYNYTNNPFQGYPTLTTEQEGKLVEASSKQGWYFNLALPGEQNSAEAIVINNVVYFTSYSPAPESTCSVTPGDAWLYAIDLALGIKKYNWSTESDNREDRIKHIGSQFLGTPTLISTEVTDADTGETSLQGDIIVGKEIIPVGFTLQTMRTSLTILEN